MATRRPIPTQLEKDVLALLSYAKDHMDTWVPFSLPAEEAEHLPRSLRWYVFSKNSPLGWSPQGIGNIAHARYSYDLEWQTLADDGPQWARSLHSASRAGVDYMGMKQGRIKLRAKRTYRNRALKTAETPACREETTPIA